MSQEVKRYDAVHIRYEDSNIRYGEGCEVEVVAAYDYDRDTQALREQVEAMRELLAGIRKRVPMPDWARIGIDAALQATPQNPT